MKKLLNISSWFAVVTGIVMIAAGMWGVCFTYRAVSAEKIITPADASIPEVLVAGPFTLKSQADIIREHTLKMTQGKTYAEMPRQIQKKDEAGNPIVDATGQPVFVANSSRDVWITATALTTALNLGIITYVFSALFILFGAISLWTGFLYRKAISYIQ